MSLAVPWAPRLPASRLIHPVVPRGRLAARAPRGHLWFLQAPSWEDADTCLGQGGSYLLLDWLQREWGRLASLTHQVFMNPSPHASSGRISGNTENKLVPGNSSLYILFRWGLIREEQAEPCAGNSWAKPSRCLPQISAANNRRGCLLCYILQTAEAKAFRRTGKICVHASLCTAEGLFCLHNPKFAYTSQYSFYSPLPQTGVQTVVCVSGVRDIQHNFCCWPDQARGCPVLRGQLVRAHLTAQKRSLFRDWKECYIPGRKLNTNIRQPNSILTVTFNHISEEIICLASA